MKCTVLFIYLFLYKPMQLYLCNCCRNAYCYEKNHYNY